MLKDMQEVLEHGYDVLNKVYFDGALPPAVITIMSSPRTYGHFTVGKVWKADDGRYHEINISAEHLDRGIEETMATLAHEMVHYMCQLNGIEDTCKGGRYHNRNFKREAEARGLLISYQKYIGYSVTEPSPEFIEAIRGHGIEKPMEISREGMVQPIGTGGDGAGTARKGSTRKYQCPCCGNSFRATKDIRVMCMDCSEQFMKVER